MCAKSQSLKMKVVHPGEVAPRGAMLSRRRWQHLAKSSFAAMLTGSGVTGGGGRERGTVLERAACEIFGSRVGLCHMV